MFHGLAISLLIVSLNLVGGWMRVTFNPRLQALLYSLSPLEMPGLHCNGEPCL